MRIVLNIVGVLLVAIGAIWFLQGINVLPGSFMTGQTQWAVYGGIACVAGVIALYGARRRSPSQLEPRSNTNREVTTDTLQRFADAWNLHDIDALMSFMTDDCLFEASAGADVCGARYSGRDAVRSAFAEVWATFPDAQWSSARHFVAGDRGVSEWTFTGTRADGTRVEVHGCDLFTFRGGRIAVKDSYRKNRPPLQPKD
jgi:steroid delta-isomerase-like uncharacterized protein